MTALAPVLVLAVLTALAFRVRRRPPLRGYVPTITRLRPLAPLANAEE